MKMLLNWKNAGPPTSLRRPDGSLTSKQKEVADLQADYYQKNIEEKK